MTLRLNAYLILFIYFCRLMVGQPPLCVDCMDTFCPEIAFAEWIACLACAFVCDPASVWYPPPAVPSIPAHPQLVQSSTPLVSVESLFYIPITPFTEHHHYNIVYSIWKAVVSVGATSG